VFGLFIKGKRLQTGACTSDDEGIGAGGMKVDVVRGFALFEDSPAEALCRTMKHRLSIMIS
jgi:hypothetical protein